MKNVMKSWQHFYLKWGGDDVSDATSKSYLSKKQITDDWLYVIDYNIERTYE